MKKTDKRKYQGKTQTLQEWAVEYKLDWLTLYRRLQKGYTFKEALTTEFKRKRAYVEIDGKAVNIRKLALQAKLPYLTVWKRVVKLGWDLDLALTTPISKKNRKTKLQKDSQ